MLKKKEIVIDDFNFNFLCKILDSGDFNSSPVTRWFDNYILDSVFRIKEVHKSRFLFSLYKSLNEKYNLKKHSSDLDIFYCMTSGGKSPSHSENYDVYIIGVEGKTLYKVGDKQFTVEKGDVLHIPKNTFHSGIGLSPRIILSFAIRN